MSSPVTLKGRLIKDPELRYTNSGKAVAQFNVVTAKRFKDAAGDWQEQDTSFWDVTAFDKLAENIIESCGKGTAVIVAGTMRQEKWQNKDGENRNSWKVLADDVAVSLKSQQAQVEGGKGSGGHAVAGGGFHQDEPPF
jgi:single-strand DNA-binding protein